jgi:hypothetical protein
MKNQNSAVPNSASEPVRYNKRIGSTNYIVSVSFNNTATETMEDKLLRLIKNEVRNSA